MANLGGEESKPRDGKDDDNHEEKEDCKEETPPQQREGKDKSVPPSGSFKSEVQLAGEFGRMEGMSALLGKNKSGKSGNISLLVYLRVTLL